jgi:copper chaperone CopZ
MSLVKYRMTGLTCEGCTCGHCGQPILFFLKCMLGVLSVAPDFEEDTVVIEYDQDLITPKEIVDLVKNRGYSIDEI